ncbi:MAG: hypothetical protein KJ072_25250 [Verrucomicrobia bacterium]|nr:hypothetical protein [Verrucomicrobiota bacterium]
MMNASLVPQWFERNGTPVCEGDSQTPVSVAQARRQGLLPSVDNVLGVIARPAIDQSAEAAARTTQICAHIRRGADRVARGLDVGSEDPAVQWLGFLRVWLAENCREVRWIGPTAITGVAA